MVDASGQRMDEPRAPRPHRGRPASCRRCRATTWCSPSTSAAEDRRAGAASARAAGAVAVVEVNTGRILALVSTPSFDPNVMTGHLTRAEDASCSRRSAQAVHRQDAAPVLPAGSTYKFVTALAALEDGLVTEDEPSLAPATTSWAAARFHCNATHGQVDLSTPSSTRATSTSGSWRERVGIDRHGRGGARLRLRRAHRSRPQRRRARPRADRASGTSSAAASRSATRSTPPPGRATSRSPCCSWRMAYAAIANGGDLFVPQLVERVETAGGEVVADYPPVLRRQVKVSPESLAILRQGMWRVVNEPGGTAYERAAASWYDLRRQDRHRRRSGEAGERDDADGLAPARAHAWFAGFAPADDPQIAVVVLVEHGGPGGKRRGAGGARDHRGLLRPRGNPAPRRRGGGAVSERSVLPPQPTLGGGGWRRICCRFDWPLLAHRRADPRHRPAQPVQRDLGAPTTAGCSSSRSWPWPWASASS